MSFTQQNAPAVNIGDYSGLEWATGSDIIKFQLDYKEDFDGTLKERFKDADLGVLDFIETYGTVTGTDSFTYGHAEQDWNRYIITVAAGYGVGTASTTMTVAAGFLADYPVSGESIYASSTTKYGANVRYGDKLEGTVNGTTYYMWVTAAPTLGASTTFTVTLYNTTATGAATVFAAGLEGVEIMNTGNAITESGEGSGTGETKKIKYENAIQRMQRPYTYTNASIAQATAFDGKFKFNYIRGVVNNRNAFYSLCEIDYMTSRLITSASMPEEINMTEGYIPFLLSYANEVTYSTVTKAKFKETSILLRQQQAPDKYMIICNTEKMTDIDDMFGGTTGLTAGGVIYDQSGSGNREIDFAFRNFTYGNVMYNVRSFKVMDDRPTLNSANSQYKDLLLFTPLGTAQNYDFGGTPTDEGFMELKYVNTLPNHDMGYREFKIDGSGGDNPVNKTGKNEWVFEKYFGASFSLPNCHLIWTK